MSGLNSVHLERSMALFKEALDLLDDAAHIADATDDIELAMEIYTAAQRSHAEASALLGEYRDTEVR